MWQPIDASGLTYGTNGFHLPFSDNSTAAALGTDTSGNGNDWTVNKAIEDNGVEMTFFEKTLTNVIWRREIVSYVFFAYLLWTNPFA